MLNTRVIPCLQLVNQALVKTVKFGKYRYIGDPINTVRIFNELEVDELCFLDIRATVENRQPNLKILVEIANECFMPLSYGGGVKDLETCEKILSIGFEKIIINSAACKNENIIKQIARYSGTQSVIASIDVQRTILGKLIVFTRDGTLRTNYNLVEWAKRLEDLGAGELLITSMDRDGTWRGFDIEMVKKVTDAVKIPVIANGGAGSIEHIGKVVHEANASAVALGSMVVYQQKDMGVLVNFPDKERLNGVLMCF